VPTSSKIVDRVRFATFDFDCRTGELVRDGVALKLQPQPAKVLAVLIRHSGEIVTRQELVKEVWGSEVFVDYEQGLNYAIRQIRSALDDNADKPRFLETLPKRGYRFIAPLQDAAQTTTPSVDIVGLSPPHRKSQTKTVVGVAVVIVLITLAIGWGKVRRVWISEGSPPIRSLAVLPLHNLSQDPEQEYFSEGMTDQLITDLSRVPGLRVISHTSVERYKDAKRSLPDIAKELGVEAVVEGTVTRSGDRVRITAQLIDARSDEHIWADSYERDFRDLLVLQDELAWKVASEIGSTVAGTKTSQSLKRAVDPAAYDAYLKGSFYADHLTCQSLEQALTYFQKAVSKDPNFAPAQSRLADLYYTLGDFPCRQSPLYQEAESAALKAIALDPDNAEAHEVLAELAFSRDWNWAKAEEEFDRAVQLDPNDADIHSEYGIYLVAMGRTDEALNEERKAQQLDPLSENTNLSYTIVLYMAHRYDKMIEHANHALTLFPSYGEDYWLGECYEKKGMPDKAIDFFLRAMSGEPDEVPLRRAAYQKNGLPGYWEEEERIRRRKKYPVGPFRQAEYYAHRGMKEESIQQLETAYQQHAIGLEMLKVHPVFDGMRDDPRFKKLLSQLRLE